MRAEEGFPAYVYYSDHVATIIFDRCTFRVAPPFIYHVICAEHENKNGGVVPGEVGVVFAGLCFLLGGDSFVLGHEHTSGNIGAADFAFSAADWPVHVYPSSPR